MEDGSALFGVEVVEEMHSRGQGPGIRNRRPHRWRLPRGSITATRISASPLQFLRQWARQTIKKTADFSCRCLELRCRTMLEKADAVRRLDPGLDFSLRTQGDREMVNVRLRGASGMSFGDIGRTRDGGASELGLEAELFASWDAAVILQQESTRSMLRCQTSRSRHERTDREGGCPGTEHLPLGSQLQPPGQASDRYAGVGNSCANLRGPWSTASGP